MFHPNRPSTPTCRTLSKLQNSRTHRSSRLYSRAVAVSCSAPGQVGQRLLSKHSLVGYEHECLPAALCRDCRAFRFKFRPIQTLFLEAWRCDSPLQTLRKMDLSMEIGRWAEQRTARTYVNTAVLELARISQLATADIREAARAFGQLAG